MGLHTDTTSLMQKSAKSWIMAYGDDLAIIFAQKSISNQSKIYIVNMTVSLCNHLMCASVYSSVCACLFACLCVCVCERER